MDVNKIIQKIKPGDRVTILTPQGNHLTGRTVFARPNGADHVTLNLGGKFGTPAVATAENIVAVPRLKFRRDIG